MNIMDKLILQNKLELFLDRACEDEAAYNYQKAELMFHMALFCEGMLAPGITDARAYANQAGPVYVDTAA